MHRSSLVWVIWIPQGLKSNYRFDISAAQVMLTKEKVDPMWADFVEFHTSPAFYKV